MTPQEFFKNDLFAENAGVVLLEVREGYSKAKLEIKPEHLNAGARTQGGAIFTLADLALARRKVMLEEREKASVPCELAAAASARSASVKIAPP